MSQIKLLHSGGNGVSIVAPDSNPASDRVLKLPSNADGTILTTTNPKTGNIIQVVSSIKSDTFSGTSNTNLIELTGLSATITPLSSSSKILIQVSLNYSSLNTTYKARIRRDSGDILLGTNEGSRQQATFALGHTHDANQVDVATFVGVDTTGDTNAHTYKIMLINDNNNAMYINRSGNDNNSSVGGRHVSTMTLMEIAA